MESIPKARRAVTYTISTHRTRLKKLLRKSGSYVFQDRQGFEALDDDSNFFDAILGLVGLCFKISYSTPRVSLGLNW
jgi:hypothetical protein